MHQIQNFLGLRPRPHWGAYSATPDPLAGLRGAASWQGRGGEGRGGEALAVEPSHFSTGFDATAHGMAVTALQQVFQSVMSRSRLTYAVPAWWGFTTSADRQRIEAILRRAVRADLWASAAKSDPPTFGDLCSSAADELFNKIVTNSNHILHVLLPPPYNA